MNLSSHFFYDFYYFWALGYLTRTGGNPYDVDQLGNVLSSIGWVKEIPQPITHTPFSFWLYVMFSYLPFEVSKYVWLSLQAIALIWITRVLVAESKATLPFLGFALALFPPLWIEIFNGQVNFIILLAFTSFKLIKVRSFLTGFVLSFGIFKPHLLFPIWIGIITSSLTSRNFMPLIGLGSGLILHAALSIMFIGNNLGLYLCDFLNMTKSTSVPGSTLAQIIQFHLGLQWPRILLFLTSCWVGLVWGLRGGKTSEADSVMLWTIACSPYLWTHSMIMMLGSYVNFVSSESRLMKYFILGMSLLGIPTMVRPLIFGQFFAFLPWLLLISRELKHAKEPVVGRE